MKSLQPSGTVLVQNPQWRSPYRGSHIPWPDNAFYFASYSYLQCASGRWVNWFQFSLVDEQSYIYIHRIVATEGEAYANFVEANTYINPDGLMGFFGQWFNYVARAQVLEKMPDYDFSDWLDTH